MTGSRIHRWLEQTEEALLARTLQGRRLERDVRDEAGRVIFARGTQIDHALLDEARDRELLEELAHAAEPATSDTELEDFLWWVKKRHAERAAAEKRH